jgi:hypothetical protein
MPSSALCRGFLGQRRGARRLEGILRVVAAAVSEKSIGQNRRPERGLCVLIAGWISGEDLKGSQAVNVRNRGMVHGGRMGYHHCVGGQHLPLG